MFRPAAVELISQMLLAGAEVRPLDRPFVYTTRVGGPLALDDGIAAGLVEVRRPVSRVRETCVAARPIVLQIRYSFNSISIQRADIRESTGADAGAGPSYERGCRTGQDTLALCSGQRRRRRQTDLEEPKACPIQFDVRVRLDSGLCAPPDNAECRTRPSVRPTEFHCVACQRLPGFARDEDDAAAVAEQ